MSIPYTVALFLVLVVMSQKLTHACIACGKYVRHADDCPVRKP